LLSIKGFFCRHVAQVVERYLDAVEVDGSIPSVPTMCLYLFMIQKERVFRIYIF
jgi:hypothetical protein